MERVATGYGLIEGPVWDATHGLYFSDVLNGGVFRLDRAGKVTTAIEKRRGIGGMALHASGGLVVGDDGLGFDPAVARVIETTGYFGARCDLPSPRGG